ncbi:MAG: DUF5681 domain-containing protein [Gammaproteobacteria bacterium]
MPRWVKGQSGNPRGKPVGLSLHTTQVRELIASRLPELVEKVLSMALDGDTVALKLCLERLSPPMRPRDDPVHIEIPPKGTLAGLGRIIFWVMGASGSLTPDQAHRMFIDGSDAILCTGDRPV